MRTTTYYLQTPQIDALVNRFGSRLEGLPFPDKLALRVVLTQYSLGRWLIDGGYGMLQALEECAIANDNCQPNPALTEAVTEVVLILDGITADSADSLLDAINAQIRDSAHLHRQLIY